jgi:hypothetical protein
MFEYTMMLDTRTLLISVCILTAPRFVMVINSMINSRSILIVHVLSSTAEWFVGANMSYFDTQLRSDSDYNSDRIRTCDDFMNYSIDLVRFARSRGGKEGFEHLVFL